MIDLYYWPTANGKKVAIMLEECGLPYKIVPVNILRGDQFSPEFLQINPNNRMPAILDREPAGGGAAIAVFESGAILMYLAEKTGQLWPQAPREKYEACQWVMWQMANQGPKFGEALHFRQASKNPDEGDQSYALRRFDDEANRLFGVMNNRLYDRRFLAGDSYSIADVCAYPWTARHSALGQNLDEFPYVKRWLDEVGRRPAVISGMQVGLSMVQNAASPSPEEEARRAKILYNQRARPVPVRYM